MRAAFSPCHCGSMLTGAYNGASKHVDINISDGVYNVPMCVCSLTVCVCVCATERESEIEWESSFVSILGETSALIGFVNQGFKRPLALLYFGDGGNTTSNFLLLHTTDPSQYSSTQTSRVQSALPLLVHITQTHSIHNFSSASVHFCHKRGPASTSSSHSYVAPSMYICPAHFVSLMLHAFAMFWYWKLCNGLSPIFGDITCNAQRLFIRKVRSASAQHSRTEESSNATG